MAAEKTSAEVIRDDSRVCGMERAGVGVDVEKDEKHGNVRRNPTFDGVGRVEKIITVV